MSQSVMNSQYSGAEWSGEAAEERRKHRMIYEERIAIERGEALEVHQLTEPARRYKAFTFHDGYWWRLGQEPVEESFDITPRSQPTEDGDRCRACGNPIPFGKHKLARTCSITCKNAWIRFHARESARAKAALNPRPETFCTICKGKIGMERRTHAKTCSRDCELKNKAEIETIRRHRIKAGRAQ